MPAAKSLTFQRQEHTNIIIALQEARARLWKARIIADALGLTAQAAQCEQAASQLTAQIHQVNALISQLQSGHTYVAVAEL